MTRYELAIEKLARALLSEILFEILTIFFFRIKCRYYVLTVPFLNKLLPKPEEGRFTVEQGSSFACWRRCFIAVISLRKLRHRLILSLSLGRNCRTPYIRGFLSWLQTTESRNRKTFRRMHLLLAVAVLDFFGAWNARCNTQLCSATDIGAA